MALLPQVVKRVGIPVIAAGGIADAAGVAAALRLGAAAVQVGTSYLRCPEATTSAVHRAALASPEARHTALTNIFTGRPARGIVESHHARAGSPCPPRCRAFRWRRRPCCHSVPRRKPPTPAISRRCGADRTPPAARPCRRHNSLENSPASDGLFNEWTGDKEPRRIKIVLTPDLLASCLGTHPDNMGWAMNTGSYVNGKLVTARLFQRDDEEHQSRRHQPT